MPYFPLKKMGLLRFGLGFLNNVVEAHLLRDLDVKEEAAPDHQNPSSALSWPAAVSH